MRFIQVGVGGFGRVWRGALTRSSSAELVALVDILPEALAAAREETGVSEAACFATLGEALETVGAEAVVCVTPPAVHHDVILRALEAGAHVITEKPFSDSIARARQMVAAADEAGRVLMVSQNYRYRSCVQTLRELVQSGQFGGPECAHVRFARASRFSGFRVVMDHPLVKDMSIHHFDLMRAVLGRDPVSVFARTWRPSWSWFGHDPCALAIFEFEGGLQLIYDGSWVTRGAETTWNGDWAVECADASIEMRQDEVCVVTAEHAGQQAVVELKPLPCENQDYSLREFEAAIAEGRRPETHGADNLKSLAMVMATVESARRGESVTVEEVLSADD